MRAAEGADDTAADAGHDDAIAGSAESSRPRIVDARRWIDLQYTRPLTVTRIARHVGLPPIRLEREFSALYGESPRDLLMRCRMQEAERLIGTGCTIAEIAPRVGYHTERLFLSDFRRWNARPRNAG
ncbi:helix-turn-helix transcriptional regulator [Hydrocarboniphaga sp.]|uniref:helix-turn-helix transcriptional regulator n=1 Tax=Hydrocarboniphaga sp. TaxID=2033016 RepID=UPI003D098227